MFQLSLDCSGNVCSCEARLFLSAINSRALPLSFFVSFQAGFSEEEAAALGSVQAGGAWPPPGVVANAPADTPAEELAADETPAAEAAAAEAPAIEFETEGRPRALSLDGTPTPAAAPVTPSRQKVKTAKTPTSKASRGGGDNRLSTSKDPKATYYRTHMEDMQAAKVNFRGDASRLSAEQSAAYAKREKLTIPEAPVITGGAVRLPKPVVKTGREHVDEFSNPGREIMHGALAAERSAWEARPADKSTKPVAFNFFWSNARSEKRASKRRSEGKSWLWMKKADYRTDKEAHARFYFPGRKLTSDKLAEARIKYEEREKTTTTEEFNFAARDKERAEVWRAKHGDDQEVFTGREKVDQYWAPGRAATHAVLEEEHGKFNARPKDENGKVLPTSGAAAPSFWTRKTPRPKGQSQTSVSQEEISRFNKNGRDYVLLTQSRELWDARPKDDEGKTLPTKSTGFKFTWSAAFFSKSPPKEKRATEAEARQRAALKQREENAARLAQAKGEWLSRVGAEGYVEPTRPDAAPAMASEEAMVQRAAYHASLTPTDYGENVGQSAMNTKSRNARAELAQEAYEAKKAYALRMGLPEPEPPAPDQVWSVAKGKKPRVEFEPIEEEDRLDLDAMRSSKKNGRVEASAIAEKEQEAWNKRMGRPSPRKPVDDDGTEFEWKMTSKKNEYHDSRRDSVEEALGSLSSDEKARLEKKHRDEMSTINAREAEKFKRRMEAREAGTEPAARVPRAATLAPTTPKRAIAKPAAPAPAKFSAKATPKSPPARAAAAKPAGRMPEPEGGGEDAEEEGMGEEGEEGEEYEEEYEEGEEGEYEEEEEEEEGEEEEEEEEHEEGEEGEKNEVEDV